MSQENLDVVRRLAVAANEQDADAFIACLRPDVEWVESGDVLPGLRGTYCGRREVSDWFREAFLEAWSDDSGHVEVERLIEGPDEAVVAQFHLGAQGRTSGAEVELQVWNVMWFEAGQVARREVFWSREDALEAVGLSE